MKLISLCLSLSLVVATTGKLSAAPKYIEPNNATGASLAVVADESPLLHTAQLFSLDENGKLIGAGDAQKQIDRTLENLSVALSNGSSLGRVLKINVYAASNEIVRAVEKTFAKNFSGKNKPAITYVVGDLSQSGALVAMDGVATAARNEKMIARVVPLGGELNFAHTAILPKGGAIYISGQAKPGELADATTKTMESLLETLKFLQVNKGDIVQIKCFIQPASQAEIARKQIAKFFENSIVPPLVFVDCSSPKLPIEIEMVVAATGNRSANESISYLTPPGFQPSNVYSKVARVNYGKLVYVSGLYGKTPQNAEKQVLEIFDSLKRVVTESGSDFNSLAKATYYVSDAAGSGKLNELRPKFYNPKRPPAASKAMVKGTVRDGQSITFDIIAVSEK
jgi:enamine deaminase RidA (YjgF/YER057c/UK114 family)